jgi:hypothetical protein
MSMRGLMMIAHIGETTMALALGSQTASVTNHIYSRATKGAPEPQVGTGATVLGWTDRHAATVTKVETVRGKLMVTVQRDHARRTDSNGMSESQTYEFTPNSDGACSTYRRMPNGQWQEVSFNASTKRFNKVEGGGLLIGKRDHYHDFSF